MTKRSNTSEAPRLQIEYVGLSALRLDPDNPRTHSKAQVGQIAKSIRSFGFGVCVRRRQSRPLERRHDAAAGGVKPGQ